MRTPDFIKRLVRMHALSALSESGNEHLGHSSSEASSRITSPHQHKARDGSDAATNRQRFANNPKNVISIDGVWPAVPHGHASRLTADAGLDETLLQSIIELLKPVDWASVHTLSRHIGVSHATIQAHIAELNRRGAVGIGERLIPPDRRTVAWLTDEAGGTGAALMQPRHSSIPLDQGAEDHSPDYGGQRR